MCIKEYLLLIVFTLAFGSTLFGGLYLRYREVEKNKYQQECTAIGGTVYTMKSGLKICKFF